ncbi:unnamed protein product [Effrenium voratum]|nr:unnamed protein product [Effrenium voratum]
MGNQASQAPKAFSALRRAGEPLNTLGYQVVHEKAVFPTTKPVRAPSGPASETSKAEDVSTARAGPFLS